MKTSLFIVAALAVVSTSFAQTSSFTPGRLVVVAATPNAGFAPNTASLISLLEYPVAVNAVSTGTLQLPATGTGTKFTNSASATSNLNLQFNGTEFTLGGYDAVENTAGITGSTASVISRVAAIVPVAGTVSYVSLNDAFNTNNFRGVFKDGNNLWASGTGTTGTGGIRYFTTGPTSIAIQGGAPAPTNTRVVSGFGGNLYFSNSSNISTGASGIWRISGFATEATTSSLIIAVPSFGTTAPSAYDFAFTGTSTCYVADDRSLATGGGLYKFVSADNGVTWTLDYLIQATLPTGIRSMTYLGQNGGGQPEFAVVTNESTSGSGSATAISTVNQVWRVVDAGSAVLSSSEKLFDGPSTSYLRGIRYIPGAANVNLTGQLNLADTAFVSTFTRTITYTVKQGATTIGSGSVVADASDEGFSISVPASASGAATIEWDGSSFLLRKTAVTLTGSGVVVGSVSVQNGDVDNSGEVDAADIDEVIANFGATTNITSDVDVSGEVDAADIDIVIANFGGVND